MVTIHPQIIEGRWQTGVALDFHTTSSEFSGYNESGHATFDTIRPEIAELLYRLKNKQDTAAVIGIVRTAAGFLMSRADKFDIIVPVPPSTARIVQPVMLIATGLGQMLKKPVMQCVATTRPTSQLKGVTDPDKRRELVKGLYALNSGGLADKNILLFDDLFRSGTTMNAITDLLLTKGKVASVRALTITKTRVNR